MREPCRGQDGSETSGVGADVPLDGGRAPSAEGSWEKHFPLVSLSFPVGDMSILKGSCREVGMSALWMLPPLRAESGCGDLGQGWVLPPWTFLSPSPCSSPHPLS